MISSFSGSFAAGRRPAETEDWSPSNITTAGWIDGADESSYSFNGSNVLTDITDKSGNFVGVNKLEVQGTPTVNNTLNGDRVFTFSSGSNEAICAEGDRPISDSSGNHWAIGVYYVQSINNTRNTLWCFDTDGSRDYAISSSTSSGNVFEGELDLDGGNSIISGVSKLLWSSGFNRQVWVIVATYFYKSSSDANGNKIVVRRDGTDVATSSTYSNSITQNQTMKIMRNRSGVFLSGRCAEWFCVADIPGTGPNDISDVQKAEGYLAWKWGLESSLPSGHPYKNSPPTV